MCCELQSTHSRSLELGRDTITIHMDATDMAIGFSVINDDDPSAFGSTSRFTIGEENEQDVVDYILGHFRSIPSGWHTSSLSDTIKLAAFAYATVTGTSIDYIDQEAVRSWLCSHYWTMSDILLACDEWVAFLNERGITGGKPLNKAMKIWNMQMNTRPLVPVDRDFISDVAQDDLQLELSYDPREACSELLREFEDVVLPFIPPNWGLCEDCWPYTNKAFPIRISRRHRNIVQQELTALQRQSDLLLALPGSFPLECEDDDICGIHFHEGQCGVCLYAESNPRRDLYKDTVVDS